jgi:hypothetical protein
MTKRRAYGLIAFMAGIAGCLTFAELVRAEDTTLTWTNPTGGEECVAAGPITLAKTQIWQLIGETDSPDATSYVIEGLMPGVYTYAATAVDDTGRVSRLSGTTEKTIVSYSAPAGSTAYQVVSISGGFWLLPVGTLNDDTECNVDQSVNGKYAVPLTAVTMTNPTSQPLVVVADCQ